MAPLLRVPNGFGGMRNLAFFAVICRILAENRGRKRELQLPAGAGFHVFYRVGMRDSQGEQSGIRDFNSCKQKRTYSANSFVKIQVISSIPLIARLHQHHDIVGVL